MKWTVTYEARIHGSIGIFEHLSDTINARNKAEAQEKFRVKHTDKYEFRAPVETVTDYDWA